MFSVYPFPLWWSREYILCLIIIIKSEIWTIIHCYRIGHETIVCILMMHMINYLITYMYSLSNSNVTYLFHRIACVVYIYIYIYIVALHLIYTWVFHQLISYFSQKMYPDIHLSTIDFVNHPSLYADRVAGVPCVNNRPGLAVTYEVELSQCRCLYI